MTSFTVRALWTALISATVATACSPQYVVGTGSRSIANATPTPRPSGSPSAHPSASPTATATPKPTATPTTAAAACVSANDPVPAAGGALAVSGPSGYSGSITLPSSNAPAGTSTHYTACLPGNPMAAVATSDYPQLLKVVDGTPILYVEISSAAVDLTFDGMGTAAFSFTLPTAIFTQTAGQQYYLTSCDEAVCAAQPLSVGISTVLGPLHASGNTLTLATSDPLFNFIYRAPSVVAPHGHKVLALIYASPDDPELQSRHMDSNGRVRIAR